MRDLEALVDHREPGMAQVREWMAGAVRDVEMLDCERRDGERALLALQVTTRSPMGALALETGGLLIDHGWLRVHGAGCPRLPRAIDTFNRLGGERRFPPGLVIADDAIGGFFAISEGGELGPPGHVAYFAPDSLSWDDLGVGYSAWLAWAMQSAELEQFYEALRWPGWDAETGSLAPDEAFSVHPPLFTTGPPLAERSRAAVPVEELWSLHVSAAPAAPPPPAAPPASWFGKMLGALRRR